MFDLMTIVTTAGYLGIFAIIFAESGLFFGFFLPGDSLLFTAGILAGTGTLDIWILAPVVFIAAVLGDSVGYLFGKKVGEKFFDREDSRFFKHSHVEKTQDFYQKYGVKTIVIARFVPIVRTFAPIMAGVGSMRYRTFLAYNIIGGFIWSVGLTVGGFILGNKVPHVDRYILPIVGVIILISFAPILQAWLKEHRKK